MTNGLGSGVPCSGQHPPGPSHVRAVLMASATPADAWQGHHVPEDACRDAPWPTVADAVREARSGAWEDGRTLCAAVRGAARYEGRLAGFDQRRHGGGA